MGQAFNSLFKQIKNGVREVSPDDAQSMLKEAARQGKNIPLVDVREKDEYDEGYVPGATHIPRGFLEQRIEAAAPDHDQPVLLYCAGGVRSAFAARTLHDMGYTNPISVAGGFGGWKQAGLPFTKPRTLDAAQRQRYSRHVIIPEVGEQGQLKLLDSKILLIGAGGLGSPIALYLAAAGIGTLGIIDDDVIDVSNLQRQVIHTVDRVGTSKAESAQKAINALNPDVNVVLYKERLNADNVEKLLPEYDLVIDGTDNFETRYLLNDFAVLFRKPVVHGSILRFEGQVTTFIPYAGPCYRCVYPSPPPPELAPNCAEAGVLGVLPGIIGLLQANEAIKLELEIGDSLAGRFLLFDALETSFYELKLRRDPNCPACGGDEAKLNDLLEQHREGTAVIPMCRLDFSTAAPAQAAAESEAELAELALR